MTSRFWIEAIGFCLFLFWARCCWAFLFLIRAKWRANAGIHDAANHHRSVLDRRNWLPGVLGGAAREMALLALFARRANITDGHRWPGGSAAAMGNVRTLPARVRRRAHREFERRRSSLHRRRQTSAEECGRARGARHRE